MEREKLMKSGKAVEEKRSPRRADEERESC